MKRIVMSIIGLFVLSFGVSRAAGGWQVAMLSITNNTDGYTINATVYVVGEGNSLQTIPIPSNAIDPNSTIYRGIISPDMRYLVLDSYNSVVGKSNPLVIMDLLMGACCTRVYLNDAIISYNLGDFDPSSQYFTASYVGTTADSPTPFGGIVTVDAATGEVVSSILQAQLNEGLGGNTGVWSYLGTWTDLGQQVIPSCYGCEGVLSGEWALLEPFTNSITPVSGDYFNVFSDQSSLANGETVYLSYDANYPITAEEVVYIPTANVVRYDFGNSPIVYDGVTSTPVVYFDTTMPQFLRNQWVNNGQHWLVVNSLGVATLVGRDGSRQLFTDVYNGSIVAGTPEGWVATIQSGIGVQLINMVVGPGFDRFVLADITPSDNLLLLRAPVLGDKLTLPFTPPVFAPPAGVSVVPTVAPIVTCPGFLPSRLIIGGKGQVTPGLSNNIRSDANASASKLGQIPAGGIFTVLEGPVCDANARAWWKVTYNSITGWTVEGEGNTYWTEPLP